jgi:hypothetical protein
MNYVQEQWQLHNDQMHQSTSLRVAAWIVTTLAIIGIAAAVSQRYWYPFIQQYF